MAIKNPRHYSNYTLESLSILSLSIKTARKDRGITQTDLAKRAGIGRNLLSRIENGEPSCEIGVVFEVAFLLGIPLFSDSDSDRSRLQANLLKQDSLLPERQRKTKVVINDDF